MPDLVCKSELATILDVSEKTVQRMTADGKLAVVERRGQTPYYDRSDSIEAYSKHAEAVRVTLQHPGGDVLNESRLARVESHYRRQAQKLEAIRMDSLERAKVFEMWSDYRQLVRDLCLSCVEQPPFTAGLKSPTQIGILLVNWQNDLLTQISNLRIRSSEDTAPISYDHIVGNPEDLFDRIEATRAKVNYCVAEYNNLLADLVAGVAVKASLVETAFARRIATVKSRIGSISTRLAPQLIGLSQAKVKELLLELVNESLEELTGIDAAELFDKAVLDIAPEKPIGETEVNDE